MSVAPGRQGVIAFFVTFCVCLVALAVALNVGWVVLTLREIVPLLLGSLVFAAIITGLILNTTFLVREIRRNEQHDAFVNAVTHELKTPVTSIRLHLETLKSRGRPSTRRKRHEFYDVMLEDSDRLLHLIEQVLSAGQKGRVPFQQVRIDLRALADECVTLTRSQRHLPTEALQMIERRLTIAIEVIGDPDQLRGAVLNLLDNAVKYSREHVRVDVEVAQRRQDLARRPRARSWHRHSAERDQAHLQPLLPHAVGADAARQRHGPRPVHRRADGEAARRPRVRAERRRGTRRDLHARAASRADARARLAAVPMSRLLIVEDEAHIASGLRFNLEADGHAVDASTDNGEAALQLIESGPVARRSASCST